MDGWSHQARPSTNKIGGGLPLRLGTFIVSSSMTGMGCPNEGEVLVAGNIKVKATLLQCYGLVKRIENVKLSKRYNTGR